MLTIFLIIMLSPSLSFSDLTVATMLAWLNLHPFLAMIVLFDLCLGVGLIVNLLTSYILNLNYHDPVYDLCNCDFEEHK